MKETAAKRREKPKDSKGGDDKQKDAGPEPQDVDMPEEDAAAAAAAAAANAVKGPKELDNLTLDGGWEGTPVRIQIRSPTASSHRVA